MVAGVRRKTKIVGRERLVRSYVLDRSVARDDRTGVTMPVRQVLDGDIDRFVLAALLCR